MKEIMTIPEVARYPKASRSKLYFMVQKNELPYVRVRRKNVRIRGKDLEVWIEKNVYVFTK